MASSVKGCRDLRPLICSQCKGILKQDNEWNCHVLPKRNLEAVGANLWQFSFDGLVEPLRWSAQPW